MKNSGNIDIETVRGFGEEWSAFDQSRMSESDAQAVFESYFSLVDLDALSRNSIVADVGCGSGRWASRVAPKVGQLWLIDPSEEVMEVARRNLAGHDNCNFVCADAEGLPLNDSSCDLIYSLGVLHHVPDTARAMVTLVQKLRPGGTPLLYLYYRFDNRPCWFNLTWRVSDYLRRVVSRMPFRIRRIVTDLVALTVYLPLARTALLIEKLGLSVESFPLSEYRRLGFYVMRTDSLDRFGTRLEQRFTKSEIQAMMLGAGLVDIRFEEGPPNLACGWTSSA